MHGRRKRSVFPSRASCTASQPTSRAGTSALLFRPEQHGIPPRIVGCRAPHVSQPLLVLGVPPDRASHGAGLLHALLAHVTELPRVCKVLDTHPERLGFGLRLRVGFPGKVTKDTLILLHPSVALCDRARGCLIPYQRPGRADHSELRGQVHVLRHAQRDLTFLPVLPCVRCSSARVCWRSARMVSTSCIVSLTVPCSRYARLWDGNSFAQAWRGSRVLQSVRMQPLLHAPRAPDGH